MSNFRKSLAVIVASILLQACGGSSGGSPIASNGDANKVDANNCAEAIEGGELRTSITLINTASECDYYLKGKLVVGASLTVEAGTTIVAAQNAGISVVEGALTALGTTDQRITVKGELSLPGFWQGVKFTDARPSSLEFVDILDGGQTDRISFNTDAGLDIRGSTVSLKNSSVSNSAVNGLSLTAGARLESFSNNRFFGNELAGVSLPKALVSNLDIESDYIGEVSLNGLPVVQINDDKSDVGRDVTWNALNAPYFMQSQLTIKKNEKLTLGHVVACVH